MSPKIVDVESRRTEITDAYLDLIAQVGLSRATSRALATELGVANGGLWTYFSNKDDLLESAAQRIVANTDSRIRAATRELSGIAALEAMLTELLPLTPETQIEARVVVNFWGQAGARRVDHPRTAEFARWAGRIRSHLEEAQRFGDIDAHAPTATISSLLMSYVIAAQVQFAVDESFPAGDLREARDLLDAYRTGSPRAARGV